MLRAFLASTALLVASGPAYSQTVIQTEERPTLSLSATAQVMIEPEFASVRSGVTIRADTAEEAVRENAEMMSSVFSALRRAGVDERDMQTSNYSVQAIYEWVGRDADRTRVLRGYQASNIVTARVRDTDEVGEVIDAMVRAGANDIQNISFGAEDTADDLDEARRLAVARLMEKAELYAGAAGLELCGVRSMREGSGFTPQPQYANAMMRMESGAMADTPVAAGELTLSATVSADFCITSG
jgi:uncharacterized protein YggE